MLLQKEREDVVKYCRKLIEYGLTKGTGGNISIFNREQGLFAISPSGIDYFETEPEDVVVMNLAGEIVDGKRKPSGETKVVGRHEDLSKRGRTGMNKLHGKPPKR